MARFNTQNVNQEKEEIKETKQQEVKPAESVVPIGRLTDTQYMIMLLEEINRKLDSVIEN